MKLLHTLLVVLFLSTPLFSQNESVSTKELLEHRNKEIAKNFYEDLWFNNRTENYSKYMADEYVAHDIGERKNSMEPAIEQKNIADRFWDNGELSGTIDYQIADGDIVATRWQASFKANTLMGKIFEMQSLPIINVFRFNDEGKIVELWNHRHDIDTNQTMKFTIKGFLFGLILAIIPIVIAVRIHRRFKRYKLAHP